MKYSIGIPTYRRHQDLKNAIESVLAQKEQDFEIIICDNDQSNEVREIVQGFGDSRMHYFQNRENIGGARNIRQCVSHARGEWFVLLSDDDALAPDFLSMIDENQELFPSATVISTAYLYGKSKRGILGKTLHYCAGVWVESEGKLEEKVVLEGRDLAISLLFEATLLHPVIAMRRDALTKIGGYFADFMYGSDLLTIARVALQGEVVFDYRVGGWYHAHDQNWSRKISRSAQLNTRRELNRMIIEDLERSEPMLRDRALGVLRLIPRRLKWKFLEEAMVGDYPEFQKQILIQSIAEDRGDSEALIRLRAWLKMNKKIAFRRWFQVVTDRDRGVA